MKKAKKSGNTKMWAEVWHCLSGASLPSCGQQAGLPDQAFFLPSCGQQAGCFVFWGDCQKMKMLERPFNLPLPAGRRKLSSLLK